MYQTPAAQIDVDEEDALAAGAADPDDGELLTLEAIEAQLFELLLMLVSSSAYQVQRWWFPGRLCAFLLCCTLFPS